VNRGSRGVCAWLSVCQAMSIAITTVLPEPVAIFSAVRGSRALVNRVVLVDPTPPVGAGIVPSSGDLGEEDRRLDSLALAEEHSVLATGRVRPVRQQLAGDRRDSEVRRAPAFDRASDVVDQRVGLTRSPVRSKSRLSWISLPPTALPLRDAGTGIQDSLGRRPGRMTPVGPLAPIWKCRPGGSYGPLRTGSLSSSATSPPSASARLRAEVTESVIAVFGGAPFSPSDPASGGVATVSASEPCPSAIRLTWTDPLVPRGGP